MTYSSILAPAFKRITAASGSSGDCRAPCHRYKFSHVNIIPVELVARQVNGYK
jgi:hypothetical protein